MAYDNKRNFPERDKNMLDDRRIGLSAPTPGVKGKWANLNWGYFGNLARLTCWTNDPEDEKRKIDVKMPVLDFCKFLVLLEMAINLPDTGEDKFWMEVWDYSWFGGKKSEEVKLQGTLYVGKKDGVVWMSLCSYDKNRPKIKFPFGNTMYNKMFASNGELMADGPLSVLVAKANLMLLKEAVPGLAVVGYKDNKSGGGGDSGGGNNNRSNNNGGGGGRSRDDERESSSGRGDRPGYSSDDDESDIPF